MTMGRWQSDLSTYHRQTYISSRRRFWESERLLGVLQKGLADRELTGPLGCILRLTWASLLPPLRPEVCLVRRGRRRAAADCRRRSSTRRLSSRRRRHSALLRRARPSAASTPVASMTKQASLSANATLAGPETAASVLVSISPLHDDNHYRFLTTVPSII